MNRTASCTAILWREQINLKKKMENLKQLKETAEARIYSVIVELERLQSAYGIGGIKEAIKQLQDVRVDLMVDLEKLNIEE